ncbi:putative beta-glucosidase 15, partial [Cucurbita argyrosperma subsp. argyrosperma]
MKNKNNKKSKDQIFPTISCSELPLPRHFIVQIEGAFLEDGRGTSNWDAFSHIPGGRFGKINRRGISFYNKVIDRLLLRGIEPFVTIHHHDLPDELDKRYGRQTRRIHRHSGIWTHAEKKVVKGSLDYIYVNHYTTLYTKDCLHSICSDDANRPIKGFLDTTGYRDGVSIGDPTGVDRFFVVPRGLEKIINYIKERYPDNPIYVTENGYSAPSSDGNNVEDMVNDTKRVNYHKNYLASLAKAMRNGADVRGYFAWSLMDNFEWADGYGTRFGLLYVDRQTLERRPKLSAQWFASFLGGHPQALAKPSSILNTNAFDSLM